MSLIYLLLNPIFQILALLVATAFFYFRKKPKHTKTLLIVTLSYFILITSTPIPEWLVYGLERTYPGFEYQELEEPFYIMVLGAGVTNDEDLNEVAKISDTELYRLVEGIRIYQMYDSAVLITSAWSKYGPKSQAEMVADAAVSLGIDPADTAWLVKPTSTETEAIEFKKRFGDGKKLVLVTDAIHMKRAMAWFESEGLQPIPAPTHYYIKKDSYRFQNPFQLSPGKIEMWQKWMHEVVGMAWFRVK